MVALAALTAADRRSLIERSMGDRVFSASVEGGVAAAISAAVSAGAGLVKVDDAFTITSGLTLNASNIWIEICEGCSITAGADITRLIDIGDASTRLRNIGIFGHGLIDGAGATYIVSHAIRLNGPHKNITIEGIEITGTRSTAIQTIGETGRTPTSINKTASTVTATVTLTSHGYSNGDIVRVYGASDALYNGIWTIAYIDANSFSYTMESEPSANASGTLAVQRLQEHTIVNGVYIHDVSEGITFTDTLGTQIVNSRIHNMVPVGGSVPQDCLEPVHSVGWVICGNTIRNPGTGNSGVDVFSQDTDFYKATRGGTITGNTFQYDYAGDTAGNSPSGIAVGGSGAGSTARVHGTVISGNTFRGNFDAGVLINRGASGTLITGNVFEDLYDYDSTANGIEVAASSLHDNVITGNIFRNILAYGVSLNASRANSCDVSGNYFGTAGTAAISIAGAPTTGTDRIAFNKFSTADGLRSPSYAIAAAATVAANVDYNDFSDATYGTSVIQGTPTGLVAQGNRGLADIP